MGTENALQRRQRNYNRKHHPTEAKNRKPKAFFNGVEETRTKNASLNMQTDGRRVITEIVQRESQSINNKIVHTRNTIKSYLKVHESEIQKLSNIHKCKGLCLKLRC